MEGELINEQETLDGELGYKGERGYSSYEIAVLNGFEGTEQDWLDHFGVDLTGYINTNDVIDNLTSTSTNYPLSAKQGKELKGLIDSLDTSLEDLGDNTYDKTETYNKTEVDTQMNTKADASAVYTKTESDLITSNIYDNLDGVLLWKNPSPTSSFTVQTIQLDSSNYNELVIIVSSGESISLYKNIDGLAPAEVRDIYKCSGFANNQYSAADIPVVWKRTLFWNAYGNLRVSNVFNGSVEHTEEVYNKTLVPVYIIGRNRSIFNQGE